jgi:4-hydroxy-3-methylbut-2-enyl diphosphate reductase
VASKRGISSYLINNEKEINPQWLDGVKTIGLTAGASTPESIVQRCIQRLIELGVSEVENVVFTQEDVVFQLPKPIVNAVFESAGASAK